MSGNDFGGFLKKQRTFKGLTVREVSEGAGISASYVTNLENGKRGVPSPDVLKRLSEPLGVPFQELMVRAGHVKYEDWLNNNSKDMESYDEMFYADLLGFPSREAYLKAMLKEREELSHVLMLPGLQYNGFQLSEEERKRISEMLKLMFPDYTPKE